MDDGSVGSDANGESAIMTPLTPRPALDSERPFRTLDISIVAAGALMLGGLAHILGQSPEFRVAHQASTITALPPAAASSLVIVDLYGVSVEATRYWSLAPEGAPIVALCPPDNPPALLPALHGGVHALISRESDTSELLIAVQTAARGGLHVAPEMFAAVVEPTAVPDVEQRRQDLTQREAETLRYLAGGYTHGQISRRMGLAETTINTYVKRIRHKLNAGNKAELTRRAIDLGYAESP